MKILAFESSCDETAVAVVEDGRRVLSDAIASQADMHALYGGVVTVDGVEPHGTRFTVTFPRAAASGAPETQKEVPET